MSWGRCWPRREVVAVESGRVAGDFVELEPVRLTVEQRGRGGDDALGREVAQLLSNLRHDSYAVAFVHTCLYDTREHGMEDYEVRVRTAAAGGDVPLERVMEGGLWSEPHPGADQMVDERYVAHISVWAN